MCSLWHVGYVYMCCSVFVCVYVCGFMCVYVFLYMCVVYLCVCVYMCMVCECVCVWQPQSNGVAYGHLCQHPENLGGPL